MIEFYGLDKVEIDPSKLKLWVQRIADKFKRPIRDIQYIFSDDEYLYEMNMQYLNHDTYTDIITFDYSNGEELHGDIFISIDRVKENAKERSLVIEEELLRVMAHGLLHMQGFKDKTEVEKSRMRVEEEKLMRLFHVEH
jgi:rRNA maturation RNase YbeY